MSRTLAVTALLLALGACGTAPGQSASQPARALPSAPPPPPLQGETVVCSADVKQCVDGSFVSRNAAMDCAFNRCPGDSIND